MSTFDDLGETPNAYSPANLTNLDRLDGAPLNDAPVPSDGKEPLLWLAGCGVMLLLIAKLKRGRS